MVPILGNEHQIPAADGHLVGCCIPIFSRFLYRFLFLLFSESRSSSLGG